MSVLFSELYTLDSVTSGDFPTIVINHDTFTRTLQDVSFPDKAGGFTFSDPTDNLANRFILWRSHGDILELQEISLHHNLTNNILKVSFGGSAIVSCHISETHEAVVCLVCTSHGASQLLFTHPRMLPNAANVSIIGNKKNVQYSFHQIKGLQPSVIRCGTAFVLHHSGVSVFAYGLSTGSIMIARVLPFDSTAPEGTEVFELCQTSIIQKLWSGITPFSSKTDNDSASSPLDIISLDLGCDEYFLATICRDHRLRLWDFKHRNCFAVLDLLEFLPRTLDLNASLDQSALHSNFAPGLCHRLSSEVVSSHSINIIVYMSMCLSSTANNMMIGLDFSQSKEVNTSYWCWIHMDIAKALNRNRECLSVLQVDPLIQDSNEGALNTYNNNDSYNTEFLSYESNMNSLLKIQKPDISVLDFIPSEIAKKSGGGNESSERGIKSKNALGGIWWLAHQTDTGDTQLDSNYFVRWTEIHNTPNDCDSYKYKNTISTFPPGVNLLNQLPSWHKLPAYIAIQSASQEQLDSLWDETGIDVQLEIFLDHLFHPGCLSWFAITNAFKSICETYGLLDGDLLLNVSDLHETRVRIHRTLLVNIIPKLSRDDVKAMFKTFYSTAIDYHEHGLQPLGLLRIHKKMSSSSTSSSVGATVTFGKTLFPNEDTIIVIRRWGFSILRHLDDVEILLWNNIPPSIGRLQSSYSSSNISSKTNTKNIIDITTDCRKILGILQKQPKWCEWESCLFDCRKFDPTANPLLLVEQVIEQLDQINECWLPPPISSSVRFKSPFSTGSLSTAHLTAVSNLISLLDNCGIMEKSCQTLQSLFDMDSNNASSPSCEDIEITSQSWLNNNSNRSSGNRNSLTAGFRRQSLTAGSSGDHGGNSSSRFMEAVSNSCVEFLRQLCFNTTETRILFTFALLILIRRNELASNGLIKLHGKHRRERKNSHNDDDAGDANTVVDVDGDGDSDGDEEVDVDCADIDISWHNNTKCRLVALIQSLGFLRTLTITRVRPTPDMDKLSIIRDHLNILGIHDLILPGGGKQLSSSFKHRFTSSPPSSLSSVIVKQTAGMTIFEQVWLNWDWLKSCSNSSSSPSFSLKASNLSPTDWLEFTDYILAEYSKLLTPTIGGGQGIVFVFWLLLWCGHYNEVIKLCNLLLPLDGRKDCRSRQFVQQPLLAVANKMDVEYDYLSEFRNATAADNEAYNDDSAEIVDGHGGLLSWWWNKDFSFIHLCIGLAKLWLGESGQAKKHFIISTNWLYHYTRLFINNLKKESRDYAQVLSFITMTESSMNNTVPKLLIPILFPKEFSLAKLFCLNRTTGSTGAVSAYSLSPDEVQIRFLMKLMSIFELSNYVPEVLDLCEFCLNLLSESKNCNTLLQSYSDQETPVRPSSLSSSRRLASVLASLRGIMENDNLHRFLCGSVSRSNFGNNETGSIDEEAQSGIHSRLADLEAALWTRMFKHELALGHYAKAFTNLRSNPDVARRRDCLRQLVVTVCDRGEAQKLISFDYGTMENEFLTILQARARASDVILPDAATAEKSTSTTSSSNPYYDVLYAYHIHRADYRSAASVMFEHSHRLIEDTMLAVSRLNNFRSGGARILVGLQRQAACLASAINALYLVPKENQWLVCVGLFTNDSLLLDENGMESDSESLEQNSDWAFANPDDLVSEAATTTTGVVPIVGCENLDQVTENSRQYDGNMKRNASGVLDNDDADDNSHNNPLSLQQPTAATSSQDKRILTLKDLLNVYTLTRARLRLAQACWEQGMLRAGAFSPIEVVHGLLSVALYDEAVRLCESYRLDPTPIIHSISSRCSELAQCKASSGGGGLNSMHTLRSTTIDVIVGDYKSHRNNTPGARCINSIASTGLREYPILPGLSNDSSPLEHETDLVQQSISALSTLNLEKYGACRNNNNNTLSVTNYENDQYYSKYNCSNHSNLPELYWSLLEVVLTRLDPSHPNDTSSVFKSQSPGQLHLIACEILLMSRPNQLYLPAWLTLRLVSSKCATERTINLLRLYIKYNRLEAACRLATDMLETAVTAGVDPSLFGLRCTLSKLSNRPPQKGFDNKTPTSGMLYMPHNLFVQILNTLNILSSRSETYRSMYENLEITLKNYLLQLQPISRNLMENDDSMWTADKQYTQSLVHYQNYV